MIGHIIRAIIGIGLAASTASTTALSPRELSDSEIIEQSIQDAMKAVRERKLEAPQAARLYALTAIALHDGFAMCEEKTPYIARDYDCAGMQPSSVALAAVNAVLREPPLALFPEQTPEARLGTQIAIVLNARLPLPSKTSFTPSGAWQPPVGLKPVLPEWVHAQTLELTMPGQFRPAGPPPLGSAAFQTALDEVTLWGEDASEVRREEAMITARFWMDQVGTPTPPGRWNYIAMETLGDLPKNEKLDMLLALNVSLYDAGIAAWETKYHFQTPRPETVINADTRRLQIWRPMADTPAHPEYVSGHSTFSGAAAQVLSAYATEPRFCTKAADMWNVQRCFDSYHAAAAEAGQGRIYGGIHYSFSNSDGLTLGADVAEHTFESLKIKGVID